MTLLLWPLQDYATPKIAAFNQNDRFTRCFNRNDREARERSLSISIGRRMPTAVSGCRAPEVAQDSAARAKKKNINTMGESWMTKFRLTLGCRVGRRSLSAALFGVTTAAIFCAMGAADTLADDFYAGKTITLAVGFTAGGGNDANARLLARHFGRHLPGTPTIIVQNMPGAASAKPVMFLDSGAPKDGTMIATFGNGIILLSLLDPEKMKVNLSKVAWIGSINREDGVCFSWAASSFKSWDDFLNPTKRFNVGASAPGSNVYNATAILKNMFNTNAHIIMGYPGSAEKRIAIESGELDGDCGSWTSVPPDWLRDAKIIPLVRFSSYSAPDMPQMPYIGDFAKSEKDKQILNFRNCPGFLVISSRA